MLQESENVFYIWSGQVGETTNPKTKNQSLLMTHFPTFQPPVGIIAPPPFTYTPWTEKKRPFRALIKCTVLLWRIFSMFLSTQFTFIRFTAGKTRWAAF